MESDHVEGINTGIWHGKLLVVGGWTLICGMTWLGLLASLSMQEPQSGLSASDAEAAAAGAGCVLTGCAGGGWLCGMAAIVIVFAALRRG